MSTKLCASVISRDLGLKFEMRFGRISNNAKPPILSRGLVKQGKSEGFES